MLGYEDAPIMFGERAVPESQRLDAVGSEWRATTKQTKWKMTTATSESFCLLWFVLDLLFVKYSAKREYETLQHYTSLTLELHRIHMK
jgi:hypothetical protein